MNDMVEVSGNIKLRLPKSLHEALLQQAEEEGVSLNQLCLMHLSIGAARRSDRLLGSEEFNRRLERIYYETRSDDKKLFRRLDQLNAEVEALIPYLRQELKTALEGKKRKVADFMEILENMYPVYASYIKNWELNEVVERMVLKVPSVKISLCPKGEEMIDFDAFRGKVMDICPQARLAYGDYDDFISGARQEIDSTKSMSIVINICCQYQELKPLVINLKEKIKKMSEAQQMRLELKPCYLVVPVKCLLES